MEKFDTLSNDTKDNLELSEANETKDALTLTGANEPEAFFRLSEVIVRDYLKLDKDSPFIQQRGIQVLNRLENFYQEEGLCTDDKSKNGFILRSLPLISSVVQLSTTIKNFNEAMEEIQKQYEIEDNPFEQATKLSYLVFTFAINRGRELCPQDGDRRQLWERMRNKIAIGLLKSRLTISGKSLGDYWYISAQDYARQVTSEDQESPKIKASSCDKIAEDSAIVEAEAHVKSLTNKAKAAQKLRQAIYIDPEYEDKAKANKIFEPIWYNLAQQYAQQVKSKHREIENIEIEGFDRIIEEREIERIKKEIEDVTKKAVNSLIKAIQIDPEYEDKAKADKTFEPIWYNLAQQYAQQVKSKHQEIENTKIEDVKKKAADSLIKAIQIDLEYEDKAKADKIFEPIWYNLAQQYAQQVKSKHQEIENTKIKGFDRITEEREIERIKKEIEDVTKKAVDSLEKSIQIDPENKNKAENEKNTTFEPIQNNPKFKSLISG